MTAFARGLGALAVLVAALAPAGARALEREIVLREQLGSDWKQELVGFAFAAEEGRCRRDTLSLTGPRGPVAVQLAEAELWGGAGDFVRSGRLVFVTDLAPLDTVRYTVRCQPDGPAAPVPTSDLDIDRAAGHVTLATGLFAARLLLGSHRYRQPVPAREAPGPVAKLRLDDAGSWFGGSRMFGDAPITGYSAELTEAGPVFAQVSMRYDYLGGRSLELRAQVAAGDSALLLDTQMSSALAQGGFDVLLSPGLPPLSFRVAIETGSTRRDAQGRTPEIGDWIDVPLDAGGAGLVTRLTPWHDWWDDTTQTAIRLQVAGRRRELRITRRDAGAWVEPGPPGSGRRLAEKRLDLLRAENGDILLHVDGAAGRRRFAIGLLPPHDPTGEDYLGRFRVVRHGELGRRLDVVKDYVLDWPETTPHPHLYLDADELALARGREQDRGQIESYTQQLASSPPSEGFFTLTLGLGAWLMSGDPEVARRGRLVERLAHLLALRGEFDLMRLPARVAALYDALIGSELVSPAERRLFRAQFAYLGYRLADPEIWSAERDYASANLNMTVSHRMMLGIVAATIPDHPEARGWADRAIAMFEQLLETRVGPAGEWPESAAHYAHVATSPLLAFAIAAKNAGFADFTRDPRFQRLMLYLAKQYTPPDPRHTAPGRAGPLGALVPIGRGVAGETWGVQGAFARAIARSAPALSRVMQWVWLRTGGVRRLPEDHLGGWEHVYLDPELPAEPPDWELDHFPENGVLMRLGLGTPHEWWIYLVNEERYTVAAESGTLAGFFARGVPISSRFVGSYPDREELLLSRVLLARGRGTPAERAARYTHRAKLRRLDAVTGLPRQQYAAAEYTIDEPFSHGNLGPPAAASLSHLRLLPEWPPVAATGQPGVHWRRQLLFVRDDDPAGTSYVILRDRVRGGQPTMWQLWTVSDKIGTPAQAADRRRFLRDAPGDKTLDARLLPPGDRYTSVGPFGVDVEFYIAEPRDTPRHTLRFGLTHPYGTLVGYTEYQDLFHLQREGDGDYFVAIVPRDRNEEAPRFETLGGGTIIRVTGRFGTDLAFLAASGTRAEAAGASFRGSAGSVQDRASGLVLSLAAPGSIGYGGFEVASEQGAELRVRAPARLELAFPLDHEGSGATLRAPGTWRLEGPPEGVRIEPLADGRLRVEAPRGVRRVRLAGPGG